MMNSSKEEKLTRMAADIYNMGDGLVSRFGQEEEFRIFTDALKDEFFGLTCDADRIYSMAKYKEGKRKFPIIL